MRAANNNGITIAAGRRRDGGWAGNVSQAMRDRSSPYAGVGSCCSRPHTRRQARKKKRGLTVISEKPEGADRVYRLAE